MPILDIHDVTVAYHRKLALWNVDWTLSEPQLVGIVGPNGGGKSTLIKAILGLVPIVSGSVRVFGQPLRDERIRVGYVPQRESVDWDFPVNVQDVALMGTYGRLGWFRRPGRARGLGARMSHDGRDARFAGPADRPTLRRPAAAPFLARALAQKADLYFMDEPFASVDAATEGAVLTILRKLRDEGKTVVVVHHDLRTVPSYFDQVLLLNVRLIASGPTATTFTESNLHKTFGGRLSILEAAGEAFRRRTDEIIGLWLASVVSSPLAGGSQIQLLFADLRGRFHDEPIA